jgi:hypothetical protein
MQLQKIQIALEAFSCTHIEMLIYMRNLTDDLKSIIMKYSRKRSSIEIFKLFKQALLFKSTGARIRPLAFTNNAQVTPVTWGQ